MAHETAFHELTVQPVRAADRDDYRQSAPVTGGMNRRLPTGGEAYGTPRNASTGSRWRPSRCSIVPETAPYLVCTIRELVDFLSASFSSMLLLPGPPLLGLLPLPLLLLLLLLLPDPAEFMGATSETCSLKRRFVRQVE
uniref:Uncharacterized protein n=1 Tax=Anopheles merus TaxID=30066 RepID=A0A182UR03_ANOME